MRRGLKSSFLTLFCGIVTFASLAQHTFANDVTSSPAHSKRERKHSLTKEDRSALLAVARNSRKLRYSGHDCSHLVHAIYDQASFPYQYADSEELYVGVRSFQRVSRPQPGDLVVWHGHVGIVTQPSQHAFLSFLSRGPDVDDYKSRYWKSRGQQRFYRYLKSDSCNGCTLARRVD